MDVFLEILKFTIPALVVFFTVYFLMREHGKKEVHLKQLQIQADRLKKETNPVKVHAYERLALFCERIKIDKLLIRLRTDSADVNELRRAMIIAIQQEYDHNITQQIYASHHLWDIIQLAKSETISIIQNAAEKVGTGDLNMFIDALYKEMEARGQDPLENALFAIREEARTELG